MDFLRRRLSDGNFLAGGGPDFSGPPPRNPPASAPVLLVVGRPHTDWVKLFRGKSVHGDVELRVEQAQFSELSCLASSHGSLTVTIEPQRGAARRLRPDFVLLQEEPGGGPGGSAGRFLMGLRLGGVPASTPLQAALRAAHPPALLAQAVQLQKELGSEGFPMAPVRYCHRPGALLTAPTFPMLVTLSPAPGGVDTVRVRSPEALGAVAAAMAGVRGGALVREEPPKEGRFRLRVQQIGAESRAMRAPLAEPEQMEAVALSPRHRDWLSACSRLLGGAEICGLEAEVEADGSERITRVLGSWLPLSGAEDHARVVDVVLGRMRAELGPARSPTRPRPQMPAIAGTPPQQRPPPQGAPPSDRSQPRPPGGVASQSPRPPQPRPQAPPSSAQPRPPGPQPRPQTSPIGQQRPQAPPAAQPRPQTPPIGQQRPQAPPAAQPRPQTPPVGQPRSQAPPTGSQAAAPRPQGQPRPQTPPIGQLRPQTPPTVPQAPPTAQPRPQTPPTSPQPRPQAPAIGQVRPQAPPSSPQPRPQAPPIGQPRPQAPPSSPQPRPQAPPTSPQPRPSGPQPRPQAPPIGQPRPQAPPTSPIPRPQAPLHSPQPRPQSPPVGQPRPQAPPTSPQPRPPGAQPRPLGPQATPTTRQPRPQAPPPGPKPALAPKPGSPAPPPPDAARSLRQSLASFFE